MKISRIKINSILGIDELEFTPEGFTVIEGKNKQGKTSVIEAIKGALKQGHDATLLRNGAESGEIVIVLDDGMSITKKVAPGASSTEVRDAGGKKVPRPAEAIAKIADMMSVNPVAFLTADKKDRAKVLLESMPLEADVAELTRLSGITVTAQPGLHALHVISAVHTQVYDARTGTNSAVKQKDATIVQLRQAMPDAIDGVEGTEDELAAQVSTATAARDNTLGKIKTKLDGLKATAQQGIDIERQSLQEAIDKLKADVQKAIDDTKAAAQKTVDSINSELNEQITKAAAAETAARDKHGLATAPLVAALALIRANRESAAKREQTLALIDTMTEELTELRATAEEQTAALAAIDKYKADMLENLPIPGLEVRDGDVYHNGVPFDRVNTAQQVGVAVGIAKLRAGPLGIICLDRCESLDSKSFASLEAAIKKADLQCFVTRVGDDDFSITTQN